MSTDTMPKEQPVVPLVSRRERRAKPAKEPKTNVVDKAYTNNRKQTKARKNNRLYLKMAAFAMSITDKRMKASRK